MRARRGAEFSRGLLRPACFSRSGFTESRLLFKKSEPNVVKGGTQKQAGELAAVDRTIDLFNHGTLRGGSEPNPLDAVSLPSTLVHLRLILPRFSDPGSYVVAVSKDRAGTAIVARGSGKTVADGHDCFWTYRSIFEVRGWIIFPGHCARERQRHLLLSTERPGALKTRVSEGRSGDPAHTNLPRPRQTNLSQRFDLGGTSCSICKSLIQVPPVVFRLWISYTLVLILLRTL